MASRNLIVRSFGCSIGIQQKHWGHVCCPRCTVTYAKLFISENRSCTWRVVVPNLCHLKSTWFLYVTCDAATTKSKTKRLIMSFCNLDDQFGWISVQAYLRPSSADDKRCADFRAAAQILKSWDQELIILETRNGLPKLMIYKRLTNVLSDTFILANTFKLADALARLQQQHSKTLMHVTLTFKHLALMIVVVGDIFICK